RAKDAKDAKDKRDAEIPNGHSRFFLGVLSAPGARSFWLALAGRSGCGADDLEGHAAELADELIQFYLEDAVGGDVTGVRAGLAFRLEVLAVGIPEAHGITGGVVAEDGVGVIGGEARGGRLDGAAGHQPVLLGG